MALVDPQQWKQSRNIRISQTALGGILNLTAGQLDMMFLHVVLIGFDFCICFIEMDRPFLC